jgi:hypothetical protein
MVGLADVSGRQPQIAVASDLECRFARLWASAVVGECGCGRVRFWAQCVMLAEAAINTPNIKAMA